MGGVGGRGAAKATSCCRPAPRSRPARSKTETAVPGGSVGPPAGTSIKASAPRQESKREEICPPASEVK